MAFRLPFKLAGTLLCCILANLARAQSALPDPPPAPPSANSAIVPADDEKSSVTLKSLPKNVLQDQEAFFTTPARMKSENLFFLVPAIAASSFLVGTDTWVETKLPKGTSTINRAATFSDAGAAAL